MFAMSAAEFSLYLGIVVIISVLGLAFWTWTQFQDTQRHLKTLEKIIYNQAQTVTSSVQPEPLPLPQSSHVVETSEDDNHSMNESIDSVDETSAILDAIEQCNNEDVKQISLPETDTAEHGIEESIEAAMDLAADAMDAETQPTEQTLDSYFPNELASVDMSNETDKINFTALSRKDLLDLAKSKGLKVHQNIKKQELIDLLSN